MTTTKTRNAKQSFESVKASAEKIQNDATQRFPEAASAGDTFRQGDIYIEKLESVPSNCRSAVKPHAQLSPGTTKGSRHILDSLEGVQMHVLEDATVLDGPVLLTTTERIVTHPEHGNVILPPGCYGITYQRAWADELRRVED